MRTLKTLTLANARLIGNAIIATAEKDGGAPIAFGICGADGRNIISAAMDDVLPLSIALGPNKAYTCIMLRKDTAIPHKDGKTPVSYGDPRICLLGGGVVIKVGDVIVGAVGVSGRDAFRKPESDPEMTDDELAGHGRDAFLASLGLTPTPR